MFSIAVVTTLEGKIVLVIDLAKITLEQAMGYYAQGLIIHIR